MLRITENVPFNNNNNNDNNKNNKNNNNYLNSSFLQRHFPLPWYNRHGWLGVKNQLSIYPIKKWAQSTLQVIYRRTISNGTHTQDTIEFILVSSTRWTKRIPMWAISLKIKYRMIYMLWRYQYLSRLGENILLNINDNITMCSSFKTTWEHCNVPFTYNNNII